jgi:hypothetical protein
LDLSLGDHPLGVQAAEVPAVAAAAGRNLRPVPAAAVNNPSPVRRPLMKAAVAAALEAAATLVTAAAAATIPATPILRAIRLATSSESIKASCRVTASAAWPSAKARAKALCVCCCARS